jgi:hypothetical protein
MGSWSLSRPGAPSPERSCRRRQAATAVLDQRLAETVRRSRRTGTNNAPKAILDQSRGWRGRLRRRLSPKGLSEPPFSAADSSSPIISQGTPVGSICAVMSSAGTFLRHEPTRRTCFYSADGVRGARILQRRNQAWRSAPALASLNCL